MDCIFCDIVSQKRPALMVYQDAEFIAFLDKYPKTWGHTLVIPRDHYRWVWDEPHVLKHFQVVNRLIQHYKQVLNIETCYQNVWGNQVHHAHIQILPKYQPLHQPVPLDDRAGEIIRQRLQYN